MVQQLANPEDDEPSRITSSEAGSNGVDSGDITYNSLNEYLEEAARRRSAVILGWIGFMMFMMVVLWLVAIDATG